MSQNFSTAFSMAWQCTTALLQGSIYTLTPKCLSKSEEVGCLLTSSAATDFKELFRTAWQRQVRPHEIMQVTWMATLSAVMKSNVRARLLHQRLRGTGGVSQEGSPCDAYLLAWQNCTAWLGPASQGLPASMATDRIQV